MLFNSASFLVFFPIVVGIYFFIPHKLRSWWLLAASSYFYMAFVPKYIFILAFTIVVDYFAGLLLEKRKEKKYLIASIVANCGILFYFKYYNFFLTPLGFSPLSILLPIGLSFHTFQAMSYTIEVFRGYPAEHRFVDYATYVMFFPQLVAGPIERPQNLLPQFKEKHRWTFQNLEIGGRLMLWGFFKKMVVADNIAVWIDPMFASGHASLLAIPLFAYQLYCDFSGYSDIALGSAKILGFDLMRNFNRPFAAHSFSDFWKRWHISLSTWFKDYVYIPLGGREKKLRNTLLVFLLSGLWHGANITFVIWGFLNGVLSYLTKNWKRSWITIASTFILTSFTFVFFRASSVETAFLVFRNLYFSLPSLGLIVAVVFLEGIQYLGTKTSLDGYHPWIRWSAYYTLAFLVLLFGFTVQRTFIYFQF